MKLGRIFRVAGLLFIVSGCGGGGGGSGGAGEPVEIISQSPEPEEAEDGIRFARIRR